MSKTIQHSNPRIDVQSGNSTLLLSKATDGIDSLEIRVKLSVKNIGVYQSRKEISESVTDNYSMMWTNPAYLHLKAEHVSGGGGGGSGAVF